ncbi:MAG: 50S ribosomal protein L32 [Peptococcaceae bacterium BRH_c4a]|nr:MAG: 50S ribosomal protein L32 [Peptococcaceae bacterium BRH_c4a]
MGVPKRKSSKQRGRQRRAANVNLEAPTLVKCPQCHELVVPHRVCPGCGFYKNKGVVEVKSK